MLQAITHVQHKSDRVSLAQNKRISNRKRSKRNRTTGDGGRWQKCIKCERRERALALTSNSTSARDKRQQVNKWSILFLICIYKLYQQSISFRAKWSEDTHKMRPTHRNRRWKQNHLFIYAAKWNETANTRAQANALTSHTFVRRP